MCVKSMDTRKHIERATSGARFMEKKARSGRSLVSCFAADGGISQNDIPFLPPFIATFGTAFLARRGWWFVRKDGNGHLGMKGRLGGELARHGTGQSVCAGRVY